MGTHLAFFRLCAGASSQGDISGRKVSDVMVPDGIALSKRRAARRDLLHRYVDLQHALSEADPGSTAYDYLVQSFRQLGYTLITTGFEEDLDRLLRIRVLEGGRAVPSKRDERDVDPGLLLLERRAL